MFLIFLKIMLLYSFSNKHVCGGNSTECSNQLGSSINALEGHGLLLSGEISFPIPLGGFGVKADLCKVLPVCFWGLIRVVKGSTAAEAFTALWSFGSLTFSCSFAVEVGATSLWNGT